MIDIIIATYNRLDKAKLLATSIIKLESKWLNKIIIVDSTDNATISNRSFESRKILYFHSSHKNQPYQRYLGFVNSVNEYLVFLDDDMEIINENFIDEVNELFEKFNYAAIALKFKDKHTETSLSKIPKTLLFDNANKLKKLKNILSGYTPQKDGKLGYNGIRGKQPIGGGLTEYVSGGAFAAQRKYLYKDFNFQLFDLYEEKIGKGEDAIIGYTLSKQAPILFYDKLFFLHNDTNESNYVDNHAHFSRRVSFSRLYISIERARLNNSNFFSAKFIYHYYTFWRTVGHIFNLFLSPTKCRKEILKGSMQGWLQALRFSYKFSEKTNSYWRDEAKLESLNTSKKQ